MKLNAATAKIDSHLVTERVSGWCEKCQKPAVPVHLVRETTHDDYTAVSSPHLFCATCCPVCGGKS